MTQKRIGLIAGWGSFPIVVAEALNSQGYEVHCLGIRDHADPKLKKICHHFHHVGIAAIHGQVRYLNRNGVSVATMAGKVFKTMLFRRFGWIKQLPDHLFLKYFYQHFFGNKHDRKDDTLLGTFVDAYADYGIELAPATDYAPELLVKNGQLSKRGLSQQQKQDALFGWELAKQMGGLDVGQSVAVKGRAVLAVEAVEGTDECIRRAGQLCPAGGFTIVKVAKPNQDMRFDVPTIGLGTLKTLHESGGNSLIVETAKTIFLDEPEVIAYANKHRISLVSLTEEEVTTQRNAA